MLNFGFIDPEKFNDINTYTAYLASHQFSNDMDFGIISILRSGIFFILLEIVNYIVGDVFITLLVFKFIPLLIIYFSIRKYDLPLHVLILFLTPVYIDLINSQLRNSLAAALIIFGYTTKNTAGRLAAFLVGCLIHLSSYVLIVVYYLARLISNHIKNKKFFIVVTVLIFTLIIINAPILIFEILNDERFQTYFREDVVIDKSYLIFSLLLIVASYVNYKKNNQFNTILLFLGFMVFELVLTGGYYTRYIALFWPLVILNLRDSKPHNPEYLLIFLYSTYSFSTNYLL